MLMLWRYARLLLVVALVMPATLATNPSPVAAAGSCSWSPTLNDQMWAYPSPGVTFTDDVVFQVGFDCSGHPNNFYVATDYVQGIFRDGIYHDYHDTDWLWVCRTWGTSYCSQWTTNYGRYTCSYSGTTCTITRTIGIYTVMPYNPSAAVWTHWYNCAAPGNDLVRCELIHQFWEGNIYVFH